MQSQADDVGGSQESSPVAMASQAAFATQIPRAVAPKPPTFNQNSALLALLKVPQVASKSIASAQTVLQPVSDSRRAGMLSRLDSKANSQSSSPSSGSNDDKLPPKEANLRLSSNSVPDDDSEKENSQESSKKETLPVSAPIREARPVGEAQEQDVSESFVALLQDGNPFEGRKRVPRSYVRITENQQALLDSKDSWYRPEAGGRSHYANIPPDVLRDLISHAGQNHADGKLRGAKEGSKGNKADRGGEEEDEFDEDDDEDDDDDDDIDKSIPLLKESKKYNDSGSDDESKVSWSESEHGDVERDTEVAADLSPLEPNIDVVESANYNDASSAPDLHSERNSGRPSPIISNMPLPPKLKPDIDYNFPSSSPGDEQELEIAVPYAIDDEVEDDEGIAREPEASQELPSTAMRKKMVIQVQQTPGHNAREARELDNGKQPDPKPRPQNLKGSKAANEGVSSYPIIPATFHDSSSQNRMSTSKSWLPASSDQRIRSGPSSAEDQLYTLQEDVFTTRNHSVIDEGGEIAEEQPFTDLECSQRQQSPLINSSPDQYSPVPRKTSRSPAPTTLERKKMHQNVSPSDRLSQQPTTSSFHTALSVMGTENYQHTSPTKPVFLTKRNESPQPKSRNFKNRSVRQSLTAAFSQEEVPARDTNAIARANRHTFHAHHSSPLEEQPVVQIEQSQPKSAISKQAFLVHPATVDTFQQSSNDYIRSSVPEGTEKTQAIEHEPEVLATVANKSRNRTPPNTERTQSLKSSEITQSSTSRRASLLESIGLASNLEIVGSPTNTEQSPLHKTTTVELFPRSPSLPVLGSLDGAGDLETADTALGASQHPIPDMQRNFTQISVKVEVEGGVEIESICSDSGEEELTDEEEIVDNEFVGHPARDTEENRQQVCNREARQNRFLSPEPDEEELMEDEEANENQQAYNIEPVRERDQSPEPTAFERFKSMYPSYSGKEKTFIWALVYIEWLLENKGEDFLRASLWDDFIRTLAAEFMEYLRTSREEGKPKKQIKSGFSYFNYLDKAPIFQNRVVTPGNLQDCLLSLNPEVVEATRSLYNQRALSLADPPRPESSHGPPSVASKDSQNTQTRGKSVANVLIEISRPPEPVVIPEPKSLKGSDRATLKRPFFETASQLQAAKKPRPSSSHSKEEADVEVPRTFKARRSLPWSQNISPQPSKGSAPVSCDRPPTSSAHMDATTTKPKEKCRATTSTSFNGSPVSPILGEPELASRSFSAIDIRTGSIGSSLYKFKTPSVPVSKAALQQRSLSTSQLNEKSKVEGWLEQKPSPVNPDKLLRKESTKRKRESGLELLDMPTPASNVRRTSSVNRLKTACGMDTAHVRSSSSSTVRKRTSFAEFLKLKRERDAVGAPSTPGSKAGAKRKSTHLEPDTQAWGP